MAMLVITRAFSHHGLKNWPNMGSNRWRFHPTSKNGNVSLRRNTWSSRCIHWVHASRSFWFHKSFTWWQLSWNPRTGICWWNIDCSDTNGAKTCKLQAVTRLLPASAIGGATPDETMGGESTTTIRDWWCLKTQMPEGSELGWVGGSVWTSQTCAWQTINFASSIFSLKKVRSRDSLLYLISEKFRRKRWCRAAPRELCLRWRYGCWDKMRKLWQNPTPERHHYNQSWDQDVQWLRNCSRTCGLFRSDQKRRIDPNIHCLCLRSNLRHPRGVDIPPIYHTETWMVATQNIKNHLVLNIIIFPK